ncbi:hypothetical protein JTE90_006248 [Oedothorax gibbosus]|uniref:Major facilitator superfamily associated domain-containing protein n=1 Tax=Oedothorax gibbosus TaxID=931172 RepID=A0AAV6U8U6_9ARAC|nr:hypothetical protein JTE90_006248 [Oedothorax gibbosus]
MESEKKENSLEIYVISSEGQSVNNTKVQTKWWHIDKVMVPFKVHFFLFVGGFGLSLPFLGVLAKDRIGLTATSYAAVMSGEQFLFIFTKTFIGYLTDYFNKLKIMLYILLIIPAIFILLLLIIPKLNVNETRVNYDVTLFDPQNMSEICELFPSRTNYKSNSFCFFGTSKQNEFEYKCVMNSSYRLSSHVLEARRNSTEMYFHGEDGKFDASSLESICDLCCNSSENCYIKSCADNNETEEFNQFKSYQFWEFATFHLIAHASINALFTLSDTACCESVAKYGSDFGRQRLYGAAGWGVMSPVGGLLYDYTKDYLVSFMLTALLLTLTLWNLWKMDLVKPQLSQNILKDVGTVMSSRDFLMFQFGVLMNGFGVGIMWSYQIWFLTTIGASRLLCGLVQTVQCFVGELPFMFFSGWIIQKVGHFNAMSMALVAYSARFLFYSYLENPWLVLPMEIVHGFTYGIFYPAVASFAKLSSKPGTEATTQSILFSTHEGLGAGLGCVLAGLGFDHFGEHRTFFFASIVTFCA